jgi:hypothetical protein
MSRLTFGPLQPDQTISSTRLNNRFTAFSQAGALNTYNVRDAAVDLPQLKTTEFMAKDLTVADLGNASLLHSTVSVVASTTAVPAAAPHIVSTGAGTPTVLDFGASGRLVEVGDILRVYWDLSVNPKFSGTPWNASGAISFHAFNDGAGGTRNVPTNNSCWLMWLQWDITDNTLTNFTEVSGQGDFNTNVSGSLYGDALADTKATTVIPAWVGRAPAADDGTAPSAVITNRIGWRGVSGCWYKPVTGASVRIYGLRLVIRGIYHSYHVSSTNYMLLNTPAGGANQTLEYSGGKMTAIHHRMQ